MAVERASPWVAVIIIGREIMILGLRGVIAADGTVMQPSFARAAQDRDPVPRDPARDPAAGRRDRAARTLDEWVMLIAAAITVASAVDYFSRFAVSLDGER